MLVVDFDYHHGNGTEAVAGDGLSYVSTHASSGVSGHRASAATALGDDLVVNVPLPAAGISTEAFVAVWEQLLPAVAAGRSEPDMLIVSAGFDYVAGDPVGDLGVGVEAAGGARCRHRPVGRRLLRRDGVAYVLEGGYDLDALTDSIAAIAAASDARPRCASGADPAAIPPAADPLPDLDD